MNTDIRTLIIDIKAAARIGHTESLWVALDGLLDLPQVTGNRPMEEAFIEKAILPIGKALAAPRVQIAPIRALLDEPQAVLRACAAAALAYRGLQQDPLPVQQFNKPGKDSRQDVRRAFRLALADAAAEQPDKLSPLIEAWLDAPSPRLQTIAVALAPLLPDQALTFFAKLDNPSDPEVRAALVEAFTALAQAGQPNQVLDLLSDWARSRENNVWVICKTLSGSWAAQFPGEAIEILIALQPKADTPKQLINTLQALYRHGANQQVIAELTSWQTHASEPLRQIARHVLRKLDT